MNMLMRRRMMMQVAQPGIDYLDGYRANGTAYSITSTWLEGSNQFNLKKTAGHLMGPSYVCISFANVKQTVFGSTYFEIADTTGTFDWLDANKFYSAVIKVLSINTLADMDDTYAFSFGLTTKIKGSADAVVATPYSNHFTDLKVGDCFTAAFSGSRPYSAFVFDCNAVAGKFNIDFSIEISEV